MRSSELKVCFLAGTLGRGGAERQLVYMLRALGQAGVATRVLCLTQGEPIEKEIRRLGVPVNWVGSSGSRTCRLLKMVKALRQHPIDILQSAHFYTNLYVAAAGRMTGAHDIGAVRSDMRGELKSNGALGPFHLLLPRNLISNSELGFRRAIERGFPFKRIHFVKNAIDLKVFRRMTCSGARDPGVRILFVGRLVEEKRPEIFLRVANQVMRELRPQPVKAIIAGDGPLRPQLEGLANSLGMGPDRLEFLGECPEMDGVYQRADMLVMTSEHEGTPNVLLEAMACGLPVIATNVGGVPEILGEGRGLLVDPADEKGLRAAILNVASDASLRAQLGSRGYEYVSRAHYLEALGRQLTGVYDRILSQ